MSDYQTRGELDARERMGRQLQNVVDWNIKMRDAAKTPDRRRHFQRNIDDLNRRLRA